MADQQQWVDLQTGQVRPVSDSEMAAEPDRYALPERAVNVREGVGGTMPAQEVSRTGTRRETPEETLERGQREVYRDAPGTAAAVGFSRGITFGGYDQLLTGIDPDLAPGLAQLRQANPLISTGSEIGGAVTGALVAPFTPAGLAARGAAGVSKAAGGGLLGTSLAAAAEGALYGGGGEVSAAALEGRPIELERLTAAMGSGALLGGLGGAGLYGIGKATSGLRRFAQSKLAQLTGTALPEGAAIRSEVEAMTKVLRGAEDGLEDLRRHGLGREVEVSRKATAALEDLLTAPETLAREPWRAARALEQQQNAVSRLRQDFPRIRQAVQAEGRVGGNRWQAMEALDDVSRRGEGMVGRVFEMKDAAEAAKRPTLMGQLAEGAASLVGFKLAPAGMGWAGARAARAAIGGRLGAAAAAVGARVAQAAEVLVGAASRGVRAAPMPVALADVSYGPPAKPYRPEIPTKSPELKAYRARRDELLSQTEPDPNKPGKFRMKLTARHRVAEHLAGIGAVSPSLADALETLAARRVSYLAGILPRPKDRVTMGPDTWRPAHLQLSGFGRAAGAVEDPTGVFQRAATRGEVTPEESEALWAVYPEMMIEARETLIARTDQLTKTLEYKNRVAISILLGVPLDPAMQANVLEVLQGSYDAEPGGGMEAPPPADSKPNPAIGRIEAPQPTEAQVEAGGGQ